MRVLEFRSNGLPKTVQIEEQAIESFNAIRKWICTYYKCPHAGVILPGTEYAMVSTPDRYSPKKKPFHFGCLPPELRPAGDVLQPNTKEA